MKTGPNLVAAEFVSLEIRQVTDPVIGELGDVYVTKGRAVFDVEAELGEIFAGHADEGDVADAHDLKPGLAFLSLQRREVAAHVADDFRENFGCGRRVFAAVAFDGGFLGRLVETADVIFERAFQRGERSGVARLGFGESVTHGVLETQNAFVGFELEIVSRTRSAFEEGNGAAEFLFEFLSGKAVNAGRTFAGLAGADSVSAVIEDERAEIVRAIAKREHGEFRIEGAGGTNEICVRTDPEDLAVAKEHAAALADGLFFAEREEESTWSEIGGGALHGIENSALDSFREGIIRAVVVKAHRARGMVGVGAIDEDVGCRDAGRALNIGDDGIEGCTGHHQHIASNDGESNAVFLEHCGDAAQFTFLAGGFSRGNAAGDDHRVIGSQFSGRDTDAQFDGFRLGKYRSDECQERND